MGLSQGTNYVVIFKLTTAVSGYVMPAIILDLLDPISHRSGERSMRLRAKYDN